MDDGQHLFYLGQRDAQALRHVEQVGAQVSDLVDLIDQVLGDEQGAAREDFARLMVEVIGEAHVRRGEAVEIGAVFAAATAGRARQPQRPVEAADRIRSTVMVEGLGGKVGVDRGFAAGVATFDQVRAVGRFRRRFNIAVPFRLAHRLAIVALARFE